MKIIVSTCLLLLVSLVGGCSPDSLADSSLPDISEQVEFSVTSNGSQLEIDHAQINEINTYTHFSDLIMQIPSMSGDIPLPDFNSIDMVAILSGVSAANCSRLNILAVTDDEYTRTVEVEELIHTAPGLCDPSVDAFSSRLYIFVEVSKTHKPVSVIYSDRESF